MGAWLFGALTFGSVFLRQPLGATNEKVPADWRTLAVEHGFDEAQMKRLERDGFLLVDESLRQAYQMYAQERYRSGTRRLPDARAIGFFITSDLMIALANSCVDEAFFVDEAHQALALRTWLQNLWDDLPGSSITAQSGEEALLSGGRDFARLFVGVPLRMLGGATGGVSKELSERLDLETARIQTGANARSGTAVLSNYGSMEPPAMYRLSPLMAGFYRTRQWLARFGFDLNKDDQLIAYLLLSNLDARRGPYAPLDFRSISQGFFNERGAWSTLSFPAGDDLLALRKASLRATIQGVHEAMAGKAKPEVGADADPRRKAITRLSELAAGKMDLVLRIHEEQPLISERIAEAAILAITTDQPIAPDKVSLAIAARLKAPWARAQFSPKILAALDDVPPDVSRFGSGGAYLRALQALSQPADPQAPSVFSNELWRLKSIQTALAGWAQISADRSFHTRVACCSSSGWAGRAVAIEPLPQFWSTMADYLERLPDPEATNPTARNISDAAEARWWAAQLASLGTQAPPEQLQHEVMELSGWCLQYGLQRDLLHKPSLVPPKPTEKQAEDTFLLLDDVEPFRIRAYQPLIAALLECATQWETGDKGPPHAPPFGKRLWRGPMLRKLALDCRHIEALCQKQLRGVPFDAEESSFLDEFCAESARYSFDYDSGWSGKRTEDFGARITSTSERPGGSTFQAATGRPQSLYVLYPVNGTVSLLRGAVLTYASVSRASIVSAEQWRTELDREAASGRPSWLQPLYVRQNTRKQESSSARDDCDEPKSR